MKEFIKNYYLNIIGFSLIVFGFNIIYYKSFIGILFFPLAIYLFYKSADYECDKKSNSYEKTRIKS